MSGQSSVKVFKKRPELRQVDASFEEDVESGRQLVELLVRGLVDTPELVSVIVQQGERTTIYRVVCEQQCIGQIIGSKGRNIGGVRAVIAATMARKGIRAIIEIPYFHNGEE